ncbi:UNVERIFIED_CONTAM: hypothetical protein FKN15_006191 [Acipenser sinensis]
MECEVYSFLLGQVTAYAVLETTAPLPEEAECYLVYEGSSQDHITEAQIHCDGNTSTLHFVVPGHNQLENVSVTAFIYMTGHPIAVLARSSVTYIPDKAHELARFLVDHSHCLTASSHLTLLKRFGLSGEARDTVDDKTTLTLAHLEFPYSWNVLGSQAGEELRPRESLLHLSVRLGLFNLSQFLLCQPGGLIALSLPNEDGATPEQLAIQTGNQALVELLRKAMTSGVVAPPPSWIANYQLTLESTVKPSSPGHTVPVTQHPLRKYHCCTSEKGHSSQKAFQKARAQPTFHAAARLSAMLSGNDEIYANAMLVDHVRQGLHFNKKSIRNVLLTL